MTAYTFWQNVQFICHITHCTQEVGNVKPVCCTVSLTVLQRCCRPTTWPSKELISSCCRRESSTFRASSSDRATTCLFDEATHIEKKTGDRELKRVCQHCPRIRSFCLLLEHYEAKSGLLTEFFNTHHHQLLLLLFIAAGLWCQLIGLWVENFVFALPLWYDYNISLFLIHGCKHKDRWCHLVKWTPGYRMFIFHLILVKLLLMDSVVHHFKETEYYDTSNTAKNIEIYCYYIVAILPVATLGLGIRHPF